MKELITIVGDRYLNFDQKKKEKKDGDVKIQIVLGDHINQVSK